MRVASVTRFGGPEVLVTVEKPDLVAEPGQAVIAASVMDSLFLDTVLRRGLGRDWFHVEPPYVPGGGVGGVVSAVGASVAPGWVGERVVARTGSGGGYAEQITVASDALIAVPDGLDLRDATALLHDGPTALRLFDNAQIQPGQWVLVVAAAGGLGALLVQLSHASGARVIAVARGERKLRLVRELGADVAVDYSDPGWAAHVLAATGGSGADVVFDGAGGEIGRAAFGVVAIGGRFSGHGASSGGFAGIDEHDPARRGVTVTGIEQVQFPPDEAKRLIERALAAAAAGQIRPVIGQTFPLEQAAAAHAAIEARSAVGKTLLLSGGQPR